MVYIKKKRKIEWSERNKKMISEPKSEGDDRVNLMGKLF